MAKCYIGRLDERNGEYEYDTTIRFKTGGDPNSYLERIAKKWYSGKPVIETDEGGNTYAFNGGEVEVEVGAYKEVSESAYNELQGIITEM